MTEFLVRLHGDDLAPIYQDRDVLTVRETAQADTGQLVVVLDGKSHRVTYLEAGEERPVVGLVVGMNRRVP